MLDWFQGAVLFHSTGPTRRCVALRFCSTSPGGSPLSLDWSNQRVPCATSARLVASRRRCSLPVELLSCFLLLCVAVFFSALVWFQPSGAPFCRRFRRWGLWRGVVGGIHYPPATGPRCRLCAQRCRRPLDAVLRCIAKLRYHHLDTPHTPDLFGFDRDQV